MVWWCFWWGDRPLDAEQPPSRGAVRAPPIRGSRRTSTKTPTIDKHRRSARWCLHLQMPLRPRPGPRDQPEEAIYGQISTHLRSTDAGAPPGWTLRRRAVRQIRHGTKDGYGNRGCRCDLCKRANTEAHREWAHRTGHSRPWEDEMRRRADLRRHGTPARYNKGCRCPICKPVGAARQRAYRKAGTTALWRSYVDPDPES